MLNSREIKHYLSDQFDLIGICPAVTPNGLSRFHNWLDAGYAGEMDYLPDRREVYGHPHHVLNGCRSIIMLGSKYAVSPKHTADADGNWEGGLVARYARGPSDYHDVIHRKLKIAKRHFEQMAPGAKFRGIVDTAPLLEREFAQLAGLGWQAKNTMLISKTDGSYFFLSAILTDQELEYDQPFEANHCGTCTACLDACPTDAFVKPHVMDARRCLSYWNIESQQMPDEEIRELMGDWLFGCDICQEVCPWNRKDAAYISPAAYLGQKTGDSLDDPVVSGDSAVGDFGGRKPGFSMGEMVELLELDDESFRIRFRKTPFWRSKRRGILRNVLIVMGNSGDSSLVPPIAKLLKDVDSLVRSAAAWALGAINVDESRVALRRVLQIESDPAVIAEIKRSLRKNP